MRNMDKSGALMTTEENVSGHSATTKQPSTAAHVCTSEQRAATRDRPSVDLNAEQAHGRPEEHRMPTKTMRLGAHVTTERGRVSPHGQPVAVAHVRTHEQRSVTCDQPHLDLSAEQAHSSPEGHGTPTKTCPVRHTMPEQGIDRHFLSQSTAPVPPPTCAREAECVADIAVDTCVQGFEHSTNIDAPTVNPGGSLNQAQAYRPEALRDLYDQVAQSGRYNYAGVRKRVPSGLNIVNWRRYLEDYHDTGLNDFLEFGWPVHFNRDSPLAPAQKNHFSAEAYPSHVQHYIDTEIQHGALLGPFDGPPVEGSHISPLMTRPKKGSVHRRVIMDLSYPAGCSINDGVDPINYVDGPLSVKLPTVATMETRVLELGPGAFLYKTDLARGYRQLRIDPTDWGLLTFKHEGKFYMDLCPPFGLRSSAMMMVRTTNAISHLHRRRGFYSISYIDDFGGAERERETAAAALSTLQALFKDLGVDEAQKKICEPSQVLTWLGIEFDTVKMTMSIPPTKLTEIAETLREWQGKSRANLHEVQSIFGLLQFVTSVAPQARLFTNRILETMRELGPGRYTTLSWGFRRDLKFFQDLIPLFKGVKIMDKPDLPAQHSLELDACLSGCGAICGYEYYGRPFPDNVRAQQHNIAHLELLNIVVAVKVWAASWAGHKVRVECDNMNSVLTLQNARAKDPFMVHCAREIHFWCARHDIEILISHAPGAMMQRADALSREHLGDRYSRLVEEDPELQACSRIHPDDRLFILINEL